MVTQTYQKSKEMKKMNNDDNRGGGGGISFCGVLAIVLIALKLAGVIKISWVWVLAPLWIPTGLIIIISIAIALITHHVYNKGNKEEEREEKGRSRD